LISRQRRDVPEMRRAQARREQRGDAPPDAVDEDLRSDRDLALEVDDLGGGRQPRPTVGDCVEVLDGLPVRLAGHRVRLPRAGEGDDGESAEGGHVSDDAAMPSIGTHVQVLRDSTGEDGVYHAAIVVRHLNDPELGNVLELR
jgi:hypothetical protein